MQCLLGGGNFSMLGLRNMKTLATKILGIQIVVLNLASHALFAAGSTSQLNSARLLQKPMKEVTAQEFVQAANSPRELARRCRPDSADDKKLYSSDFRWGYPINELILRFQEIYASEKRLQKRMYWDQEKQSLFLPLSSTWGGDAGTPISFVESVRRHVEEALRLEYVDGIFFPDMGHSHFYVPKDRWSAITDKPINEFNKVYEAFFREPTLKVLYHTAEQLKSLDSDGKPFTDRKTFWRFSSRNIFGDNQAMGHLQILQTEPGTIEYKANTIGEVSGYSRWGGGFNISASEKGCYAYLNEGRVQYFDLSLSDLEPEGAEF